VHDLIYQCGILIKYDIHCKLKVGKYNTNTHRN
jgi:hypothetical protein